MKTLRYAGQISSGINRTKVTLWGEGDSAIRKLSESNKFGLQTRLVLDVPQQESQG